MRVPIIILSLAVLLGIAGMPYGYYFGIRMAFIAMFILAYFECQRLGDRGVIPIVGGLIYMFIFGWPKVVWVVLDIGFLIYFATLFWNIESKDSERSPMELPVPDSEESAIPKDLLNKARKGNADAQNRLGYMYFVGEGINQNFEQARKLFEASSNKGCLEAAWNLASLHYGMKGAPVNYEEAFKGFHSLARYAKHVSAQWMVGMMYRNGQFVEQDNLQALTWLHLAKMSGHEYARKYHTELANEVSASELKFAEEEAEKIYRTRYTPAAGRAHEVQSKANDNMLSVKCPFCQARNVDYGRCKKCGNTVDEWVIASHTR